MWFLENGYIGSETCHSEYVTPTVRYILPDIMYYVD